MENQLREIREALNELSQRLSALERQAHIKPPAAPAQTVKPEMALPEPSLRSARAERKSRLHSETAEKKESSGNFLGFVGISCFILAVILLIRFSIDSGWLTPFRQMLLSGLFGSFLIASPFLLNSSDKSYLSMLPAGGVAILHLTVYGAVFYHQLMTPVIGLMAISGVGVLSLFLLTRFKEDIYAILSIGGTYVGAFFLRDVFDRQESITLFILVWDLIYTSFAVMLQNRALISIAAYFSLGLVSMFSLAGPRLTSETATNFAIIQGLQILLYAFGTQYYSVKNRLALTLSESWQLFPVFLFFYGQEYYYLTFISENHAAVFGILFALIVWGIYLRARSSLGGDKLESSSAVFALVSLVLVHSGYLVLLPEIGKLIAGLLIIGIIVKFYERLHGSSSFLVLCFAVGYSLFLIISRPEPLSVMEVLIFGLIYGATFLSGYFISQKGVLLPLANLLVMASLWRLGDFIGEAPVSPLAIIFAFVLLILARSRSDKQLAQSALPVILFGMGRFLFLYFWNLGAGERIVSLLVMGGLIYASGFLYRAATTKN